MAPYRMVLSSTINLSKFLENNYDYNSKTNGFRYICIVIYKSNMRTESSSRVKL